MDYTAHEEHNVDGNGERSTYAKIEVTFGEHELYEYRALRDIIETMYCYTFDGEDNQFVLECEKLRGALKGV